MHLLMANTINLLMRWFVSSKSDRLLSSKRQRAIAIKISDKIASTPNGRTEEICVKKSKGPLRVDFQMEELTETSLSRENSLLIKLQEDESGITREDGITHKYATVSAWKTREKGIKIKYPIGFTHSKA
jgi:hypothetical protein